MHFPVMSAEVIEYLALRSDSRVAEMTAGLGGHSKQIAARLETGVLVMNDRDGESLAVAIENTLEFAARIRPTKGVFSTFPERLKEMGIGKLDGLFVDLGVSMKQLTEPERGFSFRLDGPVDMRMSRDSDQDLNAGDVVNTFSEVELASILYEYGEEWRSRAIARAVVRARPITSTRQLAQLAGHGAGARAGRRSISGAADAARRRRHEERSHCCLDPDRAHGTLRGIRLCYLPRHESATSSGDDSRCTDGLRRLLDGQESVSPRVVGSRRSRG